MFTIRTLTAAIGLTLTALSLTGSAEKPATPLSSISDSSSAAKIRRLSDTGRTLYRAGRYLEARNAFYSAAELAQKTGDPGSAAMNWCNAGGTALARLDYRDALSDLLKAREIAKISHNFTLYTAAANNLAGLYLQMGNPAAAIQVTNDALVGLAANAVSSVMPKLLFQKAMALSSMSRFAEADGLFRSAFIQTEDQNDLQTAALMSANWGIAALNAGQLDEADSLLTHSLFLARIHHLANVDNALRGLAKVSSQRGDQRSAAALFAAALNAPLGLTPRWLIYTDRGEFRLAHDDLRGSLADFRQAQKLALQMRADIVPADQDRVSLENGLSRISAGLVEAGNRRAGKSRRRTLLTETFDAAELNRLWSLRALVPSAGDWRGRLPENYWDLLARYQSSERLLMAQPSPKLEKEAATLQLQLQEAEATASSATASSRSQSAIAHVRAVLDADSTLFSFYLTPHGGWIWAVDRSGIDVYAIPGSATLKPLVTRFARATQDSGEDAQCLGTMLYHDLFGAVSEKYLVHKRWLLELDQPLFDLPFPALIAAFRKDEPIYLIERAALQLIPGALMLQRPATNSGAAETFLGIGDPIYNAADPRYRGERSSKQTLQLPRLIDTTSELQESSRALAARENRILTGQDANLRSVRAAIEGGPSVIHFATHIITAPADHASGLIALSLDPSGAMGLMGPGEILAHPVRSRLVVLNGCHSGQGESLPESGLMGLTRAFIGAGARAVLATKWDIADRAGQAVMVRFYQNLRNHPEQKTAEALREAQLAILKDKSMHYSRSSAAVWAAYFLLGRE